MPETKASDGQAPQVKVAAVQMDARVGQVEANLARAAELVTEAAGQGAQLIVLPELFSTGYEYSNSNYDLPEALDGPTGTWILQTARRLGVHLVGSFPARIAGRDYIAALLAAPDSRHWVYRKLHVAMWENCYYDRGDEPVIADTELGRVGLLICWDQVFTDLASAYQGRVDLLCIPSSPPSWIGTLEDSRGNVLARIDDLAAFGRTMDGAVWFEQAQLAHTRSAGVPLIYAARCGTFYSSIPNGLSLLLALSPAEALRVLRTTGAHYRLRCPMMGRSAIRDAKGERVQSVGQAGEAVVVATVQLGTPNPAMLPPVPKGPSLVPEIPRFQLWFDSVMVARGRRYRKRHRQQS
jgi:predicted amidohydrolase